VLKKFLRFTIKLAIWFFVLTVGWVILYKFIPVPYTPLMAIRSMDSGTPEKIEHQWIPIKEISPHLQLAVICAEDQKFEYHNGFDREAIKKVIDSNRRENKKLRGASTISQQTAKNVFLWPKRSWIRKGFETYFTFLIEFFWSKERILEVYLNSIEMGNGVFGAQAASKHWFDKQANQLTSENAAAIAAILPNPRIYKAHPPTPYISGRIQWISGQMKNYGPFSLSK